MAAAGVLSIKALASKAKFRRMRGGCSAAQLHDCAKCAGVSSTRFGVPTYGWRTQGTGTQPRLLALWSDDVCDLDGLERKAQQRSIIEAHGSRNVSDGIVESAAESRGYSWEWLEWCLTLHALAIGHIAQQCRKRQQGAP